MWAMYQEGRDVLDRELWALSKSSMESIDAVDSGEKTIAIIGDRWWPQTAEQGGDEICRRLL